MTLPPLCNLFAAFVPELAAREALRRRLEASAAFAEIHTTGEGWISCAAPLSETRAVEAISQPIFFEGGDLFVEQGPRSLASLIDVADRDPDRLAQFAGDFGFIRLRREGCTIVRSCAGRVPIYYRRDAGRIYVGSRLDYFAAFAHDDLTLDGLAATAILNGCCVFPEGRTPIRNVRCLPAAHYLVLDLDSTRNPRRYWSPRVPLTRPTRSSRLEHALRLREILIATLERELDPHAGNLLFFSGGLDSSALAALACESLGRPLLTQTFTCPDEATARREEAYILPIERRYGFARTWREPKTASRCLELTRKSPSHSLPVLHLGAAVLAEISTETSIRVALDGEFADEGCGSPRRIGDWLDSSSFFRVVSMGTRNPLGSLAPLRWLIWRARRVAQRQWLYLPSEPPEGTRREIREEYSDWIADERRGFADDSEPLRTLVFRVSRDQWLAESWETTTSLGVRPLSAFYTRAALELYFACHPRELFDGALPKAVLRRAMQGYMPEANRMRTDKGDWPPLLERARGVAEIASLSRAAELLDEQWLLQNLGRTEGLARAPEMRLFDALRLTSLGNMLSAIDQLVGPKPFLGRSNG